MQGDYIEALGVDGLTATIEVVPTPIVRSGVAAWVGFCYDEKFQIQTGWHRLPGEAKTTYFEYDSEREHFIQEKWQPTTTDYSIYRDGNLLFVKVNGFVITNGIPWEDFDLHKMCDIQVGVEVLAWDEQVPGQWNDKLDIYGVSYRRLGATFYKSPTLYLCTNCLTAFCGHINVSATSVSIWDGRLIIDMDPACE